MLNLKLFEKWIKGEEAVAEILIMPFLRKNLSA